MGEGSLCWRRDDVPPERITAEGSPQTVDPAAWLDPTDCPPSLELLAGLPSPS